MTTGLEMCVLEVTYTQSITGDGCESFTGVRYIVFVDGVCPWDLSLGHRTGNEEI